MGHRYCIVVLCAALAVPVASAGQTAQGADYWQLVRALTPGTRIVVTLQSNVRVAGRFLDVGEEELALERGRDRTERLTIKRIVKVETNDPLTDGAAYGALIGAGAALSMMQSGMAWCRRGCEDGRPVLAALLVGTMGGTVGSVAGFIADLDAGGARTLYPPTAAGAAINRKRPSVRFGPAYLQVFDRSGQVEGSAAAPGLAVAFQPSPHLTYHVEYRWSKMEFRAAPGAVPAHVVENEIPAASRIAGFTRGLYSRQSPAALTHLLGVVLPAAGRVRVELLGGLEMQQQRDRDYYDAYSSTGNRIAGKYYLLDFESPEIGLVFGADAEVSLLRNVAIVPAIRFTQMSNRSTTGVGVGAHWRF
jgi:hypothetical protein